MREKIQSLNLQLAFAMLILAVVRIILSVALGTWFPAAQMWDDRLMIEYSDFKLHFSEPVYYSLVKDMSFPLFLNVTSIFKIPYTAWLGILWVIAALLVYFLVKEMTGNRKLFAFLSYLYVLFIPQAFDAWSGTRLYRTAIIAPFVIMVLVLLVRMVLRIREEKGRIGNSIALGILFTFTYYIKEDGLWLMACLLFAALVAFVCVIIKDRKLTAILKGIVPAVLPIVIFVVVTLGYKAINNHYFGVFEVNTRTDSEVAKFTANLYKVDAEDTDMYVWASADSFDKLFTASETLRNCPGLYDAIMDTPWCENGLREEPLIGDIPVWMFRDAIYLSGNYTTEKDLQLFLRQVNKEIDEAFKAGTIKKTDRHQLLTSAGALSFDEILSLKDEVLDGYLGAITYKGFTPGIGVVFQDEIFDNEELIETAAGLTNVDYLDDYRKIKAQSDKLAPKFLILTTVYKIVNIVLLAATVLSILYTLIRLAISGKNIKTYSKAFAPAILSAAAAFVFLGITLCYTFSIGWFSSFLFADGIAMLTLNFYNIALPGLLWFAYMFGVNAIINYLPRKY